MIPTTLLDIASARQTDTKYHRMVSAVCSTFGVRPAHLTSPLRTRKIARPRQIIMYLATTDLGLSTTVVGRLLGGRDHTTVIHGRRTIAGLIETNSVMRDRVEKIRAAARERAG
jgi:chromosomal replication initiator protein